MQPRKSPNSITPYSILRLPKASLALLQKGHFDFEKTMTLFAPIADVAVSLAAMERGLLRMPPKQPFMLPLVKKAIDVESIITRRATWVRNFILYYNMAYSGPEFLRKRSIVPHSRRCLSGMRMWEEGMMIGTVRARTHLHFVWPLSKIRVSRLQIKNVTIVGFISAYCRRMGVSYLNGCRSTSRMIVVP